MEANTEADFQMAQAILDGAGISLPNGTLIECYDELGTRYVIPVYCLSQPINLVRVADERSDSPAEFSEPVDDGHGPHGDDTTSRQKDDFRVKVRLSLTGTDLRFHVCPSETVFAAKKRLRQLHEKKVAEPSMQRWYYGGKLLTDKSKIGQANITPGHVIQCLPCPVEKQPPV